MEIKLGRNGKFLSCSRYPDCDGALTLDGTEFKKDEPIGTDPTTGLPIFVLNGRFGPYVQLGMKPPKKEKKKKAPKVPKEKVKKGAAKSKKQNTESTAAPIEASAQTPTPIPAPAPVKPRMASIPKSMDPSKVTVTDALVYLSLPRVLGQYPATGKDIIANNGRFGPYIMTDGDFRSIKAPDDVYTISLARALEMLAIPKKPGRGRFKKKTA